MTKLIVFSLNVCGLNTNLKIAECLDILSRKKVDIALLQETHIIEEDIHKIGNNIYKIAAYSSSTSKTKGVIILIRNNLKFHIVNKGNDLDGRIAYMQGAFCGKKIALVVCTQLL